jgi:hypothetical protein
MKTLTAQAGFFTVERVENGGVRHRRFLYGMGVLLCLPITSSDAKMAASNTSWEQR